MTLTFWKLLLTALLVACLESFNWAIRSFFVKAGPVSAGMKLTEISTIVFAILHVCAILSAASVPLSLGCAAALMYVSGVGLFWWAIEANRVKPLAACFSTNEKLHLVNYGPYRFVRHPFYCSYMLTWSAGLVATRNLWLLLTVSFMFSIYMTAAHREEEKFAHSSLAGDYAAYRHRTGAFLPNPWKLLVRRSPAALDLLYDRK